VAAATAILKIGVWFGGVASSISTLLRAAVSSYFIERMIASSTRRAAKIDPKLAGSRIAGTCKGGIWVQACGAGDVACKMRGTRTVWDEMKHSIRYN
jgi:hypothetical protein